MSVKADIGVILVVVSLLVALAVALVFAIVTVSPWLACLIPFWVGLALIWWDGLTE